MAKFKPDDVARRCLCIDGVPGDVQLDEIRAYLTGMIDFHFAKSGKHVFLFKDEQAARSQLQKTPKIILKNGRTPNNTACLNVNLCDVGDINTSWLYQNQLMEEQGTIYVNAPAAEEPLYQNPAQLGANNEQTFEWNRGNNPNQHQHPIDTSAIHPPPGMGPYGPGWGQYPHPNQGYPGQHGFQQPGSGQSTYSNQDRNQQNPHIPNPSQFPHGTWYGPGFPPYFPPGMGYPSPGGMHAGKDQQVPPQFYPWGLTPPPSGVQMPNTSEAGPGIGHLDQQAPWFPANFGPQYSPQLQYGPPPPHESSLGSSSKDGSSVTKVKSALFDTRSDDSNKETKLPPSMTTKSPSKEETVSPEDVATEDQDEFPEIKKQKQEGQGRTSGEMSEKKEPLVKNNEQDEPIRKIKVTKLPDETTEDTLMNFFENRRRNGGGPIESIELHPATSSAIIEFKEADAVDRVLKKAPLLFLKKQISVEEYVEEVEYVEEEEEEEPPCRTIEVRGFAENTLEEVLEMYFENTKRSGGGDVTSVVIEGGVALVTFSDENVVSSVLQREHTVDGQDLIVALHLPKKKPPAMEVEEEEDEPLCTIEVRGYKMVSEDTLQMYFENTKRSGGGEIINFEKIDMDRIIFITFASEEVARNVAERDHVVGGCNLNVKLYVPPKHKSARSLSQTTSEEPEESVPHCTIEVRGVTNKILGTLQLYFENKKRSGGDEVVNFEYKEEDEIAYITFQSEDVAKRVVSQGQHKVEGQPLKVKLYIPPPPRPIYEDRVLLTGFTNKVTQDGLTNFLEAKTGLTPVKYVYGEDEGKVIITFEGTIEKSSMLSRSSDHENENVKLTYEDLTRLKEIILAGPENKEAVDIVDTIKKEDDKRLKTEVFQYLAELLRHKIISGEKHAKFRIWPGMTILPAEKIKFVCLYKGKLETKLPSFFGIDIHYKDLDIPEPLIDIEDHEKLNWEMTTDLDASLLQSAIEEHGDTLFKQHSNLQVICGAPFSIRNRRVVKQCTIILYCHAKGIIPYGEETFPSSLNFNGTNIPVDIREGQFMLAVGRQEWHKSLCMGISIGEKGVGRAGTLGPFVDLGHNEYGFLTCAHVVGDVGKEVVQPSKGDSRGQKTEKETICGTVEKFVFEPDFCNRMNGLTKTGVDAALVKLNKDREIEATNFAEVQEADLDPIGFAPETKFHYVGGGIGCPRESRKARGKMVIKYGRTTGLSRGVMVLEGAMVKIDDLEQYYEKWNRAFIMKGQYLVDGIARYQFAAPGDSGAGVFTLDDENKLTLIGLVAGGLDARFDHRCVITPIEHILTALQLNPDNLKFHEKIEID